MQIESWAQAVKIIKGLTGQINPPTPEYVQYCFKMLHDKFSDDEVITAATQIASYENLYGQYPGIILWRKYCPSIKQVMAEIGQQKSYWIEELQYCTECDPMNWDVEQQKADVFKAGGDRGEKALNACGLSIAQLRSRGYDNKNAAQRMISELARAWDDFESDAFLQLDDQSAKKLLAIQ